MSNLRTKLTLLACLNVTLALGGASERASRQPEITESRLVNLTQTVTLHDIPAGTKNVRLWMPLPSDTAWQRVVDCQVVFAPAPAPGTWKIVKQAEGRGEFVFVEIDHPTDEKVSVVVQCKVHRDGVQFPLEGQNAAGEVQPALFADDLDKQAPLMEVDERIRAMADKICGDERDPARQAVLLMQGVAAATDHYSKDATKPKCGRGAAGDCLDQGGGCCTDLHSLFIALARARGIPARIQYGYRLLDAKAGAEYDPGYRCWVEFFISGAGWVPTDIVAADAVDASNPARWASLSATRVWLWEGRSFHLTPESKAGRIDTMICGWAEIDGKPVDPLPSPDGTIPSQLRRTVKFEVVENNRPDGAPKLPE